MPREHIVKAYDEELDSLRSKITQMGKICVQQLSNAVESLKKQDAGLAEAVILGGEKVNGINSEIDGLTFQMLAIRQPVAVDLRNIISALKMTVDLTRTAHYAANIARCVKDLNHIALDKPVHSIIRMADIAQGMLRDILSAYEQADGIKAQEVLQRDKQIDIIYAELLGEIKTYMAEEPGKVEAYTSLMFAARCCERIGDHIKNLAESVLFIQKGLSNLQENKDKSY